MPDRKFFYPGSLPLPNEVLELVFSYIPTRNLLVYSSIPFIRKHAIAELNTRNLEINLGTSQYRYDTLGYDIVEKWRYVPIGDETMLEQRSYQYMFPQHIYFQDGDGTDEFLEFMKHRPKLRLESIRSNFATLMEVYEKDPYLISRIQKILLFFHGDPVDFLLRTSNFPFPIHSISTSGTPKYGNHQFYLEKCPLVRRLDQLSRLNIGDNIDPEELKYLPRRLKDLTINLESNPTIFKPCLPETLETLDITFPTGFGLEAIIEFDIGGLKNLKNLSCQYMTLKYLSSLKASDKIESLYIYATKLESLRGIEKYTRLTDLDVTSTDLDPYWIFDCNLPDSIQRLSFQLLHTGQLSDDYESEVRRMPNRRPPIQLPPKVRSCLINSPIIFFPQNYVFPESLRILCLSAEIMPSVPRLPNLIVFKLSCRHRLTLPEPLPRSLVYLETSIVPENEDFLVNPPNLTRFKYAPIHSHLSNFEYQLPESLRALDLGMNHLGSLNVEDSNLTAIDLSSNKFFGFEGLELPDTVQELDLKFSVLTVLPNDRFRLPANLSRLNLSICHIDTESLNKMKLKRLRHLSNLTLAANDISELKASFLPTSLKVLELSSNSQLQILDSDVFKVLTNLQYLYLRNCEFSWLPPIEFPPSLKYLTLEGNNLTDVDGLEFSENHQMKKIELSGNPFANKEAVLNKLRSKLGRKVVIDI
ncbi:uncharacterized protein J8A68_000194 [[Candida] subhashii]|uniref:F-box domain-containing protein n=1 Tax=[Candida] subhashii TaxID=561895 RepID=A0A8J5QU98_9ASCO|nr:uncharacterized protein J8A68_000194 [[Candida] subhashii]KAG7666263.1 hypothetical protein J8A68_000194 [[Candida] subhashii]